MLRMSGGSEFQRLGAERLKALPPMVLRRAEGTKRWREEEDLSEREGMAMERKSDRYGGGEVVDGLECMEKYLECHSESDRKPV